MYAYTRKKINTRTIYNNNNDNISRAGDSVADGKTRVGGGRQEEENTPPNFGLGRINTCVCVCVCFSDGRARCACMCGAPEWAARGHFVRPRTRTGTRYAGGYACMQILQQQQQQQQQTSEGRARSGQR